MPRQENIKQVVVRLDKEIVNGRTYDVLFIDEKEICAFDLKNIEDLHLVHNNETILKFLTDYLKNAKV